MIALRDRPRHVRVLHAIGAVHTLVASTISSRLAKSARARPTISSLVPSRYTLAVSKKLMPASTARWMNGRLVASSSVQAWPPRSGMP